MTHRFSAVLVAALLALVLAACANTASETTDAGEPSQAAESEAAESEAAESEAPESEAAGEATRVTIDGSAFEPAELTVPVGTEVTWENADSFAHTVTEGTDGQAVDDPIVDEEIAQDGTVSVTFDEPGTYEITCEIHPSMHMTVTVEG